MNEFSNIPGYKIIIQKSFAFLYANNGPSEKEINNLIPVASKTIKYLGINLNEEVKNLYTEKYDIDERNSRRHK